MLEVAVVVLSLALVGAVVWIARLSAERARLAAERDLAAQRLVDSQQGDTQRRESFQALAGEVLQRNSAQFLQLAEQKLAARDAVAQGELDKRRAAVDQLVAPIGEALKKT